MDDADPRSESLTVTAGEGGKDNESEREDGGCDAALPLAVLPRHALGAK